MEIKQQARMYECRLLRLEAEGWQSQGQGELGMSSMDGANYVFFTNEDGSELCWRAEQGKRFQWDTVQTVKFYCDIENVYRAFNFNNREIAQNFWSDLQVGLRLEPEEEKVNSLLHQISKGTPTSSLSHMYQAVALTAIEAMAYAKFKPSNLDRILTMIRDRPDAVHELLASNAQLDSLGETYIEIKTLYDSELESAQSEGIKLMLKLLEVIKGLFYGLNLATVQYLLAADTWKLVFAILEHDPDAQTTSQDFSKLPEKWDHFKSACRITKDTIKENIILNFKLVYLRDCFFDRTVDDKMVRHLTAMINTSYIGIILHIITTPSCTNSLVQNVRKKYEPAMRLLLEISYIMKQHDCLIMTAKTLKDEYIRFFRNYRLLDLFEAVLKEEFKSTKSSSCLIRDELVAEDKAEPRSDINFTGIQESAWDSQKVAQLILDILLNVANSCPELLWEHCVSIDQKDAGYSFMTLLVSNYDAAGTSSMHNSIEAIISMLTTPSALQLLITGSDSHHKEFVQVFWSESHQAIIDKIDQGDKKKHSYFQLLLLLFKGLSMKKPSSDEPEIFNSERMVNFLVEQLSNIKVKTSTYACLSLSNQLISSISADKFDTATRIGLAVAEYLINIKPRGLLLSQISQIFINICRRGLTTPITEILRKYQNKFVSPSRVKAAVICLEKYQEGIDCNLNQDSIVGFFQQHEIQELKRQRTIDPELASFIEPGNQDFIVPDYGEIDSNDDAPVKLLKLN